MERSSARVPSLLHMVHREVRGKAAADTCVARRSFRGERSVVAWRDLVSVGRHYREYLPYCIVLFSEKEEILLFLIQCYRSSILRVSSPQ